jgi:hypothetical protein
VLVRQDGLLPAIDIALRALVHRYYLKPFDAALDRLVAADTSRRVSLRGMGIGDIAAKQAHTYEPTPGRLLRLVLMGLNCSYRDFTFVDLGSGKGRAVCVASFFPFQRIIGVELSTLLHHEAKRNVDRLLLSGKSRCTEINLVNADAQSFEFPAANLIVYMFNPFEEMVVSAVADHLRSIWAGWSEIIVVYYNPVFRNVFDATDFLEPLGSEVLSPILDRFIVEWPIALYRSKSQRDPLASDHPDSPGLAALL